MVATKTVLEGERIELTPLQLDNIYQHFEWNNDPELNHLDSEVPYTEESFGNFKKRFERILYHPSPTHRDFEIHLKGERLIGVALLAGISEHHRHCTIGITIGDRSCWGQGYGRETMDLVLAYCFGELGLHRVAAETFEYNLGWKRLVEGSGFTREGAERDYLYRDAQYWDKEIYSLLEDEYEAHRSG